MMALVLSFTVVATSCGPKITPEDIAKTTCKCIQDGVAPLMGDLDKYSVADTSTFKQDMLNEAKTKIESTQTILDDCSKKSNEVEENKEILQDLAQKASYDELVNECTKGTMEKVDKAKSQIKLMAEQIQAAATADTLKKPKDDAKHQLNIRPTPQKGGSVSGGNRRVKGR